MQISLMIQKHGSRTSLRSVLELCFRIIRELAKAVRVLAGGEFQNNLRNFSRKHKQTVREIFPKQCGPGISGISPQPHIGFIPNLASTHLYIALRLMNVV